MQFLLVVQSFFHDYLYRMQLFYAPDVSGDLIALSEEESRHCAKVLRKRPGETIMLTDGAGKLLEAELVKVDQRECLAKPIQQLSPEIVQSFKLTIGIAPSKNTDRFEWFLEKATEIGVDTIVPLVTKRTERSRLKHERLNKIILAAMKQSGRVVLPQLEEAQDMEDFLKRNSTDEQQFIATCFGDERVPLKEAYQKGRNVVILIGPEGDFTPEEATAAMEAGFKTVSLGRARLRLETAGVVACHTLNLMNE